MDTILLDKLGASWEGYGSYISEHLPDVNHISWKHRTPCTHFAQVQRSMQTFNSRQSSLHKCKLYAWLANLLQCLHACHSHHIKTDVLLHLSIVLSVRITDQMTLALRCNHSSDFLKCCRSPDICHRYTVSSDRPGHLHTWAAKHRSGLIYS